MSNTAWHLSRARNRFKTAREAIGGVPMSDNVGLLAMGLLHLLDGVIALLDKRIAKAKGGNAWHSETAEFSNQWLSTASSRAEWKGRRYSTWLTTPYHAHSR